jgi:NADPH-dependent curcumin reductase CurA
MNVFLLLLLLLLCRSHLARLCSLVQSGQLAVALDSQQFKGLGSVPEAVQRLQGGASSGKVVVQLAESLPAVDAAKL